MKNVPKGQGYKIWFLKTIMQTQVFFHLSFAII